MKKDEELFTCRERWGPRGWAQSGSSPRTQWPGAAGSNLTWPRQAASCRWQMLV